MFLSAVRIAIGEPLPAALFCLGDIVSHEITANSARRIVIKQDAHQPSLLRRRALAEHQGYGRQILEQP